VRGDVPVDSEALFVTDFMNLKIKSTQSFGGAHRDMIYVHVFIEVSAHMCMSIYICTVFLKKGKCTRSGAQNKRRKRLNQLCI
jgi:hypothetical protein